MPESKSNKSHWTEANCSGGTGGNKPPPKSDRVVHHRENPPLDQVNLEEIANDPHATTRAITYLLRAQKDQLDRKERARAHEKGPMDDDLDSQLVNVVGRSREVGQVQIILN